MRENVIVECERLSFSYSRDHRIFADVDVSIDSGSFVHLQGPSGSGKSTFLRLLNRLDEPTAGVIRFRQKPLGSYPAPQLRRSIAYIQQTPTLLAGTVRDNLMLPFTFKVNRNLAPPDGAALDAMLQKFLLDGVKLTDMALNLSGGQRQRLCLLRSMLLSPEVMLLDEPVSALDPESRQAVESTIESLNVDHGLTVVLASHQGFEAKTVAPVILEIRDSQVFKVEGA